MNINDTDRARALHLDYTIEEDKYGHLVTITRKPSELLERRIWPIVKGYRQCFQTANVRGGYYRDHQMFNSLSEALERNIWE